MIRIVVTVADAGMAANVGGPVHLSHKTFDIDCPAMEALLKLDRHAGGYVQAFVSGAEVLPPEAQ